MGCHQVFYIRTTVLEPPHLLLRAGRQTHSNSLCVSQLCSATDRFKLEYIPQCGALIVLPASSHDEYDSIWGEVSSLSGCFTIVEFVIAASLIAALIAAVVAASLIAVVARSTRLENRIG